jgi:O-antigen ligase/tetratricopeptide (TPR) repeat protein
MSERRVTKAKTEGTDVPVLPLFDRGLRVTVLAGIYGALLAILVVSKDFTVFPYVFLPTILVQASVALTVPAFLLLVWRQPVFRPRRSWLSLAVGAYFVALSISCAFAFNRHRSFWGSQDRMGGLFTLAYFIVWYVMATSLLQTWRDWRRVLHWQAVLGFVVSLAALQDMRDPRIDRISGLLGNPIYCATYEVFVIGILALLWVRTQSWALRALYAVGGIAAFVTLLLTGSRGPVLGLVCGVIVVALMWTIIGRRWRLLFATTGALSLAGAGYAWLVRMGPTGNHLLHLFTKTTYEMRPMIWSIALDGFRSRPLLGWGLDNFEAVFDAHFLPRIICSGVYDQWTDIAHSLLFEHLATTGALGTLAFAAIGVAFVLSLRHAFRHGWVEARTFYVLLGTLTAYLVQGQFITDSPSSHSMLFLLLAVACAAGFPEFAAKTKPTVQSIIQQPRLARSRGFTLLALAALQLGGVVLAWYGSLLPALTSHASLQSTLALKQGGCGAMLESARRAAAMPTPWSEDQVSVLAYALRDFAKEDKLQACPQWRDIYEIVQQKAAAIYAGQPEHFRFRGVQPALAYMLGFISHDRALIDEAQRLYEALIASSPQHQLYRYRFASLLADTGRVQAADDQLTQALAADPDMGESVWRLGMLRWQHENQVQLGSKMVTQAANGMCRHQLSSSEEAVLLAQAFGVQGNLTGLSSMKRRMEELPPEDSHPASAYLDIARVQEQNGLFAERDSMLRIAAAKDASLGARLAPLFDGRVRTIAEAERTIAMATTGSATKP